VCAARDTGQAVFAPRGSRIELLMGVQAWTDAHIGQSLEINISLTIAKS